MALVKGAFPYDLNNLLGGAVRVLLRPVDVAPANPAPPADPSKIFKQEATYDAVAPFVDCGATKEAFQYGRNIDVGGYQIQQVQGNVIEEITNVARTVRVSVADIGPEGLRLIEQSDAPTDVAAAAGHSAFKKVSFGSISDLRVYQVAFVSRRSLKSGQVKESDGKTLRGRFLVGVGFNVSVSADNVEMQQAKGELAAAQVTFRFFPDTTQPEGQEYGAWFDEAAGTIA